MIDPNQHPGEAVPMEPATPTPVQAAPESNQVPFYQPQAIVEPKTPVVESVVQTPVAPTPTQIDIHMDARPDFSGAPQVIEKVVYKKERIHGFFRTLAIISLAVIGFLMLIENYGIMKVYIGDFALNTIYPIFIIFSSIVIWSYRGLFGKIFGIIMFLTVVGGFFTINTYNSLNPSVQSKVGDYISYMNPGLDNTGIQISRINVNTLVGGYEVKGKETDNLVEGKYKSDRKLFVNSGVKSNYDYLKLSEDNNRNVLQNIYTTINLGINSNKLVDLYFKNLLGINNIDLSEVQWFKTSVHGGIQDVTVTLGERMFNGNQLDIQMMGGFITLYIPKKVGVRLEFKQLAGSLELSDFDIKGTNKFESRNISIADNIVNIKINSGISKFKIIWK